MHFPPRLDSRFWRLWWAVAISYTGDGMVLVAFPLLAVSLTRSALLVAGVLTASRTASLLGALPAGVLADRYSRRRLLMLTELSRFAILAVFGVLVVLRPANLAEIYATAFLLGGLAILFECASSAALPTIVPGELLVKGNAYLNAVDITSQDLLGQSMGGFLFAAAKSLPFIADALSFVGSAVLLTSAVPDVRYGQPGGERPAPETVLDERPAREPVLRELRDGLRWFRQNQLIKLASYFNAAMAFCQALVLGLAVLYATRTLQVSNTGFGLILGISGIGNVVGAVAAHRLHQRWGTGTCILTAGVASAVAYPIMGLTHSPVTACGALTLETMAVTVGSVALRSLRQANIPEQLQGRVGSVHMTLVLAAFPCGALAGGLLASNVGIRTTLMTAGILQLAMVALMAPKLLSLLRRLAKQSRGSDPVTMMAA